MVMHVSTRFVEDQDRAKMPEMFGWTNSETPYDSGLRICDGCDGFGYQPDDHLEDCSQCGGKGKVPVPPSLDEQREELKIQSAARLQEKGEQLI